MDSREAEEEVMSAKYNKIVDNMAVRLSLNLAGFGLWLLTAFAILRAAV